MNNILPRGVHILAHKADQTGCGEQESGLTRRNGFWLEG